MICGCNQRLEATDDERLGEIVSTHLSRVHPDHLVASLSREQVREVVVVGYFINYYTGQEGKIEEIRFADDTISDAQTQDISAASTREGSGNVTAQDLAAEAK